MSTSEPGFPELHARKDGEVGVGIVAAAKWNGVIVAVKVVEHDPDLGNALNTLLESTLAQSINHPNLVRNPVLPPSLLASLCHCLVGRLPACV